MFLLRCLFWLGLAFSQIAQREGAGALALAEAASAAASGSVDGLGRMAAGAAERQCRGDPAACLALVAQATGAPKPSATVPGRDTLSAADRAPTWRGVRDKGL